MVGVIFLYYFISTFFPIDKVIGKIYPIFGGMLIFASVAIFIALLPKFFLLEEINLLNMASEFHKHPEGQPIIPMLFVTIACGIISGFHSTQSPIVARTEKTERTGRQTFYGMMILEGLIGMIWAAGGMFIYQQNPALLSGVSGVGVLNELVSTVIPLKFVSWMVIIGVVVLAITSGDTSLRSLRLTISELFRFDQSKAKNRLLLTLPIFALCFVLILWSNSICCSLSVGSCTFIVTIISPRKSSFLYCGNPFPRSLSLLSGCVPGFICSLALPACAESWVLAAIA